MDRTTDINKFVYRHAVLNCNACCIRYGLVIEKARRIDSVTDRINSVPDLSRIQNALIAVGNVNCSVLNIRSQINQQAVLYILVNILHIHLNNVRQRISCRCC